MLPDKEKINKAEKFSEQNKLPEEFKDFFKQEEIKVSGNYQETWEYIKEGTHSLSRNSNFHLFLERITELLADNN